MERTADPEVMIESREGDTIVYRRSDGVRWKVTGKCDRRGLCLIGSVIGGEVVRDLDHLKSLGDRPDSELDVPIGIGWKNDNNCCHFDVEVLENADV